MSGTNDHGDSVLAFEMLDPSSQFGGGPAGTPIEETFSVFVQLRFRADATGCGR